MTASRFVHRCSIVLASALLASCGGHSMTPQPPQNMTERPINHGAHPVKHHHYKLIDMGTFGGPASSINYPFFLHNLNSRGIAIGWSAYTTPTSPYANQLVCGGLDFVIQYITHAFEWNGNVVDLGALGQQRKNCSEPFWVNEKGEIAGASEIDKMDPYLGWKQARAVLWKDGRIVDLGNLGGYESLAYGMNDRGEVVGNATNAVPDPYCFFGSTQGRAFLWQHGKMQDLGTLGGNCGISSVINDRGHVAGWSTTSPYANPSIGFPPSAPFFWTPERGMVNLGSFGGVYGAAQAINNHDEVIGQSSPASDPGACFGFPDNGDLNCHPFLWERGHLRDLYATSTGGNPEFVANINDSTEIVGAGAFPNEQYEPFLLEKGSVTDLGHLDGCGGVAASINNHTQIVGSIFLCSSQAFLWENGSIVDLNTLIQHDSPLRPVGASGINNRGEIVGSGVPHGVSAKDCLTRCHGFVLVPCDENHPNIPGCDYSLVITPISSPSKQQQGAG